MQASKIEWTERTWNPVRGCSRISPGCCHCYAETMGGRFCGEGQHLDGFVRITSQGPRWTGKVEVLNEKLTEPLKLKKRTVIFVNSTSDLFHENLTDGQIFDVFRAMVMAPQHVYLILTKRHERMMQWVTRWMDGGELDLAFGNARGPEEVRRIHRSSRSEIFAQWLETLGPKPKDAGWPCYDWAEGPRWWPNLFSHIVWGVSIENQTYADKRLPCLNVLARLGWNTMISAEPLLGPIRLPDYLLDLYQTPWVIVGGESGTQARRCDVGWIRRLVQQCEHASIPVFVKQLGSHPYHGNLSGNCGNPDCTHPDCGFVPLKLKATKGGDPNEWPRELRVRQFPSFMPATPAKEKR